MAFLKIKTNVSEYSRVIDLYGRARGKTHEEVVTRVAQQANFRCVASEAKGGVRRAKLGMFPLNATGDPQKGGKTFKNRFFYAERASNGVKKGSGGNIVMRPAAYKAYEKRRKARGSIAAGFLQSARDLGLKKKGPKDAQVRTGGSASRSTATKARGRLKASSVNAVKGSYEVGRPAMDIAIVATILDMQEFAHKELRKPGNKINGRGIR